MQVTTPSTLTGTLCSSQAQAESHIKSHTSSTSSKDMPTAPWQHEKSSLSGLSGMQNTWNGFGRGWMRSSDYQTGEKFSRSNSSSPDPRIQERLHLPVRQYRCSPEDQTSSSCL